jgi:predicted LPLAT superfamily acyltransferase
MAATNTQTNHWSGTGQLRGGRWGIWFFVTAVRLLGLQLTYALAIFPAIYFSFASPDVDATMDFHRRIFGPQPRWKRRWLVIKHFHSFGRALIDRTAILAGQTKGFSFQFDGDEHLRAAVAEGRGVLLLTAHLGNWEAAGQLLTRIDVPITITGFDKETPEVREVLNRNSQKKFKMIPLTGGPTDAIPLVAALRRGEVVAMLGDRSYGSPSTKIPFCGGTASFPIGAYVMASIAGAALMHVFSCREPGRRYRFFGFPAQHPQMPAHHERAAYLKKCAANYAGDLESVLRRDPFQWYNFFPFWENDGASASAANSASEPSPDGITHNASRAAPKPGEGGRISSRKVEPTLNHVRRD